MPVPRVRTIGVQPTSPSQQAMQPITSKPSPKPRIEQAGLQTESSSNSKEKKVAPPGWNIPMNDDDDEFDITEEDLAKMAASMVDDRAKKPNPVEQLSKPLVKPKPQMVEVKGKKVPPPGWNIPMDDDDDEFDISEEDLAKMGCGYG